MFAQNLNPCQHVNSDKAKPALAVEAVEAAAEYACELTPIDRWNDAPGALTMLLQQVQACHVSVRTTPAVAAAAVVPAVPAIAVEPVSDLVSQFFS